LKYRAEIDGLRAFAVVPVILFHAGFELFSGGFVGVDVFFVISGYLITTILIEDIQNNRFSIVNFYERRARRILPALYVVSIATAIASTIVLFPEQLKSFAKSLISVPLFSANFYFWSERGYFGESSELKPLIHIWSLAVEEQFYIVFPVFLLLLSRHKKTFYALLSLAFLLSIASSYYVTQIHFDTAFYFPVTRAWELLFGSFAALLMYKHNIFNSTIMAELVASLGLLFVIFSYLTFDSSTPFPGIYALIPVFGTFLFIISSSSTRYMKTLFSYKPIVYTGLLSFSLYLWHQPIFALTRHVDLFNEHLVLIIFCTVILSYLTYNIVEQPFRNRSNFSRKSIFISSATVGIVIVLGGLVIVNNNGLPNRFAQEDRSLLEQLANYQGYNERAFDSLENKAFGEGEFERIVVIGDSYAKDFLNIVIESNHFADVQFSTRQVNSECGNLYLDDYSVIESHIPENRLARCKVLNWYGEEDFVDILKNADEIWVVSAWRSWVIDYLPTSVERLSENFKVPIRVFGIKNFGSISTYELLSIPASQRIEYTQSVDNESIQVSSHLSSIMGGYELFYPLLNPLCDGDFNQCKIFTDDGLIISADGGHLTREGAIESAERLNEVLISISNSIRQ
tara:strand:- start:108 stop:1985 length:1878 start_codon:yes stop_codon:yes gene_type:complete